MDLIKEFPWTAILSLLVTILGIVFKYVFDKHIAPYLTAKGLADACAVAVDAAEALYGRSKGDEKLAYALKLLDEQGWNVDADLVMANIKAAWQNLNLKQIDAGVKQP